jgi:1-acyl-sn-glycerol-3-phosphate acyltransferase
MSDLDGRGTAPINAMPPSDEVAVAGQASASASLASPPDRRKGDDRHVQLPSTPGLLGDLWYDAVYVLTYGALTLGFSMRAEGMRHVPRTGPVLLIANHQSFLDPVVAGVAVRRRAYYLARKTLFRHRVFGAFIGSLNAVPVDQEGIGIEGLRKVLALLQIGRAVLVFPEGQRSANGSIEELRPGIHLLLRRTSAPVVALGIAGTFDAWPRWRHYPHLAPLFVPAGRATIAVSIGRRLDGRALADQPRERALVLLRGELQGLQARAEHLRRREQAVRYGPWK